MGDLTQRDQPQNHSGKGMGSLMTSSSTLPGLVAASHWLQRLMMMKMTLWINWLLTLTA